MKTEFEKLKKANQDVKQSENYFKDVREEIVKDIQLKAPLQNENALISKKMSEVVSVSLHIRRTHGIEMAGKIHHKIHGGLDLDYYQRAIEMIAAQHPNLELFVFSDDIEWAKENFKIFELYFKIFFY
jgi:hypothetical protein